MLGRSVLIAVGQVRILSRLGVKESYVTVEFLVVVYAFLRFSYSGYGVYVHMVLTLSQLSGWKYPTPNFPSSAVFVSATK